MANALSRSIASAKSKLKVEPKTREFVAPTEEDSKESEMAEERRAAEGKSRKLNVTVSELPTVRRNQKGEATSAVVKGKAQFKGDVVLHLKGDIASAYWSVTPGMVIAARVFERDDNEYDVDDMDIVPQG